MKRLLGIAILATVMACNQTSNTDEHNASDSTEVQAVKVENTVALSDQQLDAVLKNYLILKDVLVKSDAAATKSAATTLHQSIIELKNQDALAELSQAISSSDILEEQRKSFTALNENLIDLLKKSDIVSGTLYVQHCPMANKGDGGDWISTEKEIRNPYYGDEMLACGRVVEEIVKK